MTTNKQSGSSVGNYLITISIIGILYFIFGWMNKLFGFHIPLIPNALFFVTLLGWANPLMWPAIWPLALNNLGKCTKIGSALIIMGIAGGVLIPPTYAKIGKS